MNYADKVSEVFQRTSWTQGQFAIWDEKYVLGGEIPTDACLLGAIGGVFKGDYDWFACLDTDEHVLGVECLRLSKTSPEMLRFLNKLKEVICEQFPDRIDLFVRLQEKNTLDPRIIYNFNDHIDTTFEDIQRVVEKTGAELY